MRRNILILPLLLLALTLAGQDAKQDFADGEFFLAQEEYEEALYTFNKVYDAGYQNNANVNYRVGLCLLNIAGRKTEAIPYLEKAVGSVSTRYTEGSFREENAPPDAHLYLGNAYRINHEFDKAREQYRLFEEYMGDDDLNAAFARQQMLSLSNAVAAINNPVNYGKGNLGQLNQTHDQIYNMVVSHDLQTMAYMAQNPFYKGVYVSRKVDGLWQTPMGINASIVSEGNMDVVGLSPDGNTMLLAVSDAFASNIYTTRYADDRWYPAESIGRPINSRYYEYHACFSPDMQSIYFSSNRKESLGGMDIFRSDKQEDGSWGEPVNLGPTVNTVLNEESPMISPDGKRLYFSSQGHQSMGGFDVFYVDLQEDNTWGQAVNPGYPLNNTDDNFALNPSGPADGTALILAGGDAEQYPVFKFEMIARDATPVPVPFDEPYEEILAEEPAEPVKPKEPVKPAEPVAPVKPATPEKYLIEPIFFGFDSYALSADAKKELDDIAEVLNSFTSLNLEIIGHTDALGSTAYNQVLSERRAKAAADYLKKRGIAQNRLKIVGKSESQFVARNTTRDNKDAPEGRKLNRRVVFKVSQSEKVIVEMKKIEVPEHLKLN